MILQQIEFVHLEQPKILENYHSFDFMQKEMGMKLGIIAAISIIALTGSLLALPFVMVEKESKSTQDIMFGKLKTAEDKMFDFIEQERNEYLEQVRQAQP